MTNYNYENLFKMKTVNKGIITITGLVTLGITGQQCTTSSDKEKESAPNFIILFADNGNTLPTMD